MPVHKRIQSGEANLCLWKITEDITDFNLPISPKESDNLSRNQQWLAGRAALDALDVDVEALRKDDYGKPWIQGSNGHVSLSHCKSYAAAIKSQNPVGIDIEEITPRIERIAPRFVHESEWAFISEDDRLKCLYILWSAKEALYKLYGKKSVDFKHHMIAKPFEISSSGVFYMEFLKNTSMLYVMQYEVYDNHTLVWVEG